MSDGLLGNAVGRVPIDSELGSELMRRFPVLSEDGAAHRAEHAIEVQLPFLQVQQPRVALVPIAIGTRQFEVLRGTWGGHWRKCCGRESEVLVWPRAT